MVCRDTVVLRMAGTKRKRGGKKGGGRAKRSRYVGVWWDTANQKWRAKITVRGVRQHLGCFRDEADGARAYDAAVTAQNPRYPDRSPSASGQRAVLQAPPRRVRQHLLRNRIAEPFG